METPRNLVFQHEALEYSCSMRRSGVWLPSASLLAISVMSKVVVV